MSDFHSSVMILQTCKINDWPVSWRVLIDGGPIMMRRSIQV